MDTPKHTYETTVIINASLDDAQTDAVIARIQESITKNGGTIAALNKWGRKRLSYSINKKTNGFYVSIEFTGSGDLIGLLERSYQLDEMILRYLTIKLDKKALAAKAKLIAVATEAETPPVAPVREPLFDEPGAAKATEQNRG